MNATSQQAFLDAAGISASALSFNLRLLVGGLMLVVAVLILGGLMHLLDSASAWDKMMFFLSVMALSFITMMVFIYIA